MNGNTPAQPFPTDTRIATPALLESYRSALARLKHFGLNSDKGRLREYLTELTAQAQREAHGADVPHDNVELANAMVEARQLIDVASLSDETLRARPATLARLKEGRAVQPADKDDPSRNFQLEYVAAAYFSSHEARVNLGDIGDAELVHGLHRWPMEVKRARSAKSAKRLVVDARNQLQKRVSLGTEPGVILLDATTPLTRRFRLLQAATSAELEEKSVRQLEAFLAYRVMAPIPLEVVERPELCGIIVRYAAVGFVHDEGGFRELTHWQYVNVHKDESTAAKSFEKLMGVGDGRPLHLGTKERLLDAAAHLPDEEEP
ncbi:hypothetical protein [Tahibacter sp.]|uniref:hypothetical protein n=1 Tax=Tahibacter sp. TaxID=2056211 RepID=UPI0028C4196C|nr:hypothetical protein [Tahibacter sp.]